MVKGMKIKGLFLETGLKKGARPMGVGESVCMWRIKRPQPTLSHKSHPACTKGSGLCGRLGRNTQAIFSWTKTMATNSSLC